MMTEYREPTSKDGLKTFLVLTVFVLYTVGIILLAGQDYPIPALFLLAIGLFVLIAWHDRISAYKCAECGSVFTITILKDFLSPHGPGKNGGWTLLRCPDCGKITRAQVLVKSG